MKKIPYFDYFKRIILIGIFIGIDLVLAKSFIKQTGLNFLQNSVPLISKTGIKIPSNLLSQTTTLPKPIDTDELLRLVNQFRSQNQVIELGHIAELDQVALYMIDDFAKDDFQIENKNYDQALILNIQKVGYQYDGLGNTSVIGPSTATEIFDIWMANPDQAKTFLNDFFTHTGIASKIIKIDDQDTTITVQVFATPKAKIVPTKAVDIPKSPAATFTPARDIPDNEVVEAINQYRSDHQVHQLIVDQNLCKYAEKRVQDLIAFGGLDNHEGFKKDFEDLSNLPEPIKAYSGGTIGENLASQYCINGTTGANFVATTGTALIEWCFDSSVKGHREAQLNPRYNAVCVRHGKNMYVVIFGE